MKFAAVAAAMFVAGSINSPGAAGAEALATYQMLTPETALELAQSTLKSCRDSGYQVAVAVVDRMGSVQVILRDRFGGPHTPDTARRKAWTAVSFRNDTLKMSEITQPGSPQAGARFIEESLMIGGGVPIEAGGSIVGGLGVSGTPDGKADDACARAGIEAVREKLEL